MWSALTRLMVLPAALLALGLATPGPARGAPADGVHLRVGASRHMDAILLEPDGPGPFPSILLLHTSGGLETADLDFAAALSRQGYVVLAPAFMEAYGVGYKSRVDCFTTYADSLYADFSAALSDLAARPRSRGKPQGVIGFSNGGYFAAWLAATGRVQAAVGYYGAYSAAGSDRTQARFRALWKATSSPLLILHGTGDQTVPVRAAQRLAEIARGAGAPCTLQLYPGAGHRFERTLFSGAEGSPARDAWSRTLAFFAANLRR